MTVIYIYLL